MGSIYIILCLILVAALSFWAYKSHQRKVAEVKEKARLKAIKDEEIRKRNEALRIQRLEERQK